MRFRLTFPALACAIVLVLTSTISPAEAVDLPQGESITTKLHPGWNLVGWLGPEAPAAELFEAIPALKQAYAWNGEEQRYLLAEPASTGPQDLVGLTPGMGLWLLIDGESPVPWTRSVVAEGLVLPLHPGRNLVVWSGDEAGPVGDTLTRLGDKVLVALRWEAASQRWESYYSWVDGIDALSGLNRGDALLLELAAGASWWVPGAARPTYLFGEHVSEEEREATRRMVERVRAVFAEYFGIHTADFTVSVPLELPITGCNAGPKRITTPPAAFCTAHEYFHVLQFELSENLLHGPSGQAPNWLVEGPATYAGAVWGETVNQGQPPESAGFDVLRKSYVASVARVPSLENAQGAFGGAADYDLGFLASEWLVGHAGVEALADYHRRLPSSVEWETAFLEAFGISVEHFYTSFGAYRSNIAPALPHVADDMVRPVIVFLGDVPADVRTAMQARVDSVHAFLNERFGAGDLEYSAFLGADWDAVEETVLRLWPDAPGEMPCGVSSGDWMFSTLACGHSPLFPPSTLINASLETLRWNRGQHQPLLWFDVGLLHYLLDSYAAAPADTASDALRRYTTMLQESTVLLPELETGEGFDAAGSETSTAVSTIAIDWLAKRAGAPSLLQYYRLVPRGNPGWRSYEHATGSWQAAFRQAFGLTIEEFYEHFETYSTSLPQP